MPRARPRASSFVNAVEANPQSAAFCRVARVEEPARWRLRPMNVPVLSDDGSGGGFYIVRALNVLPDGHIAHCLMDVSYPERINDFAYFIESGVLRHAYTHECPGKIIPAIAFDCFGVYETFYAPSRPDVGLEVLKRGLAAAERKRYIAQDLGYILRDEKRYQEAAEMFELVVAEKEAPLYYTYMELARLYRLLGNAEQEAKYLALAAGSA